MTTRIGKRPAYFTQSDVRVWSVRMRMGRRWTPSIVPGGKDETVYLILNDFGKLGRSYLETDEQKADLEAIIIGMIEGQYSCPTNVIAFNAAAGWSRDVSEDIADEIRSRCDRKDMDIPAHLEPFMDRHENRDQHRLRLV